MTLRILNCEQGTPEWFAARLGIPTASRFADVIAQGRKKGDPSKTRRVYMMKLIGERLTGEQMDSFENRHTERGHMLEDQARQLYKFAKGVDVQRVGFVRNEGLVQIAGAPFRPEQFTPRDYAVGCSPDSLIGDKGLLEIKTKLAHLQCEVLLGKELPSEHRAQVQGQLWVCEREWCDFVSYWPKLPPFIHRVYRDDLYIARLAKGVQIFCNEMATLQRAIEEAA